MQGRVLGDNRQTGRTTKMLAAALRKCFDGGAVAVVLPYGLFSYIVPILRDMGATTINQSQHVASFGADAKMYFYMLHSPLVSAEDFEVRGYKSEHTFWDHEAIRQAYNHVIMRYHEYD